MATAYIVLPLLAVMAACKAPPEDRHAVAGADPESGRKLAHERGCGSCHHIPGVWPQGTIGPPLTTFAGQALIAGRLPNRADVLAAFVRDAPSLIPDSTMPAMPLSEGEARDVAAFLYTLKRR